MSRAFRNSFLGDDALRRAVRDRHRHAIEQSRVDGVAVDATMQHERAVKF
jgi:hypothetical protein